MNTTPALPSLLQRVVDSLRLAGRRHQRATRFSLRDTRFSNVFLISSGVVRYALVLHRPDLINGDKSDRSGHRPLPWLSSNSGAASQASSI